MKKLLRVLVVAALLVAIAIPCLADGTPSTNKPECQHDYNKLIGIKTESTCTVHGTGIYQCSKCEETTERADLELADHQWYFDAADPRNAKSTCKTKGTEIWRCKVCKKGDVRELPLDPNNHEGLLDKNKGDAGTWSGKGDCKNKSWTATKWCPTHGYLDKVYGEYGEHSFVWISEAATCTKEGHSGKQCSKCQAWADDAVTYPKADHTKDNGIVVSKATCTAKKVVRHWCTVCKALLGDFEEGKTLDHTPGEAYTVTEPTCTEEGLSAYDCKVCGAKQIKTWKTDVADHKYEIVTVDATCTKAGTKTETCKVCGATRNSTTIPALGHEWVELKEEAHDCIPGKSGKVCSRCGETKDVVIVKAPKDHVAGDWKVTKAPTCTEKGEEAKSCTVCSKVLETREVAATGHKAGEYTQTKAPTCTEKGEEVSKCTVCNAVVDTREVAAKGHTAGEWITVRQPSASQNGKMIQKCTVCGAQIGKKYIRANGSADTAVKTVAYVAGAEVANYAKIDLTVDATTELDLVSANGTKVGKLVVEVKEGKVTVKYELSAVPADAFLTFVTEAPAKDIHAQKEFEFEKAISVADELAGAAAAYIYVEIEY